MRQSILVVADDPEVLRCLEALFGHAFALESAASVEQALALLDEGPEPLLLIADSELSSEARARLEAQLARRSSELVVLFLEGEASSVAPSGPTRRRVACEVEHLMASVQRALERRDGLQPWLDAGAELELSRSCLRGLNESLEGRLSHQAHKLRVLRRLSIDLSGASTLQEIAGLAADALHDALDGHAVHVQLWDVAGGAGVVHANRGGEMSTRLHCETLGGEQGALGEIVVDATYGARQELSPEELEVLTMIAGPTAVAARNEIRRRERDNAQHATILALARLAEKRDNETGRHVERVSQYCKLVAEALRFRGDFLDEISDEFIDHLVRSAPLHDIGKVGIPDSILLKPGRLTPAEFEIMKTHASLGAMTLDQVIQTGGRPGYLEMGRDIAQCHHEKWNGAGYPAGLAGDAIPLCARILALADVYDALTSVRPYKDAWPHAKAMELIRSESGKHFDPRVVEAFASRESEAESIRLRLADELALDRIAV